MLEIQSENKPINTIEITEKDVEFVNDYFVKKKLELLAGDKYLIVKSVLPAIEIFVATKDNSGSESIYKFIFDKDFYWDNNTEKSFNEEILYSKNIITAYDYDGVSNIYKTYNELFPDWHLKRYLTKITYLFDHIHHCQIRNTAKEMLYKAGLEEMAMSIENIDNLNIFAVKPTELYDGITMRTLRALNCKNGAEMLLKEYNRSLIKQLQKIFPDIFKNKLNEYQCRYMCKLIEGDLTVGEVGRLFQARRKDLMLYWSEGQYREFLAKMKVDNQLDAIYAIDPLYKKCVNAGFSTNISRLYQALILDKEELNRKIRVSNRQKNQEWQERDNGYVVRYPQTVNDFCREAVYQQNCLFTYLDAVVNGDTTILFLRRKENVNMPFITIEIYQNTLMQAYRRFNADCTYEEASWIINYCDRHNINRGRFRFNKNADWLIM